MRGENSFNNRCGRNIGDKWNRSHTSSPFLHKIFSDNPFRSPISSFYKDIGLDGFDEFQGVRFVKEYDVIYAT